MKKIILTSLMMTMSLSAMAQVVQEMGDYNVVKRYKILEDKFETYEMLDQYGHDFIFDVRGYTNRDLLDLIDEIDEAYDYQGTDEERIAKADEVFDKYKNTEQTARAKAVVGVPLPTFTVKGVTFVPDFRVSANWGGNVGVKATPVTTDDILAFVGSDLPPYYAEIIKANETALNSALASGGDIIDAVIKELGPDGNGALNSSDVLVLENYKNKYYFPDGDLPYLHAYTKLDVTAGLNMKWFKNHIFGIVNVYGLHRTDYLKRITSESIINDKDIFKDAEELNSTVYLDTDLFLGYRDNRYSIFAGVEELKIAKLSDKEEEVGPIIFGTDPLYRVHADADYRFKALSVKLFTGLHWRDGYDLSDGLYVGTDVGAHVFEERLGIRGRIMLDNEHVTLAPRLRFGVGQLEYVLKVPHVSNKDGIEPSTIHSVQFSMFF